VLDTSALVALFDGHSELDALLDQAYAGQWNLILPAACVAEASTQLGTRESAWDVLLLTSGVTVMPLDQSTALAVAHWPGSLSARHAVYEANRTRAVVVTTDPGQYAGLRVALLVV
jgi:hypothetical protein